VPIAWGGAISHSPILYRERKQWQALARVLVGAVPQPAAAETETAERLVEFEKALAASFKAMRDRMADARLDALVVLVSDRNRFFDEANCPQLHVFAGDEIWGETAHMEAGETSRVHTLACDAGIADLLIEELFDAGFDLAESHGVFRPSGQPDRGAVASLFDPVDRLDCSIPIVPVHINCHVAPTIRGARVAQFGSALGEALRRSSKRVGVLASGGMSGDPGGYLAGWIDPTLDRWVLRQLESGRCARLAPIFDVESNALRGNSAELRLWLAAAAAMESQGFSGKTIAYHAMHATVTGAGFFAWESDSCR